MKQKIATIRNLYSHFVGNKSTDDRVILSRSNGLDNLNESSMSNLRDHFLEPFELKEDNFSFYHEVDINLNEVYSIVSSFFSNSKDLLDVSIDLARILLKRTLLPSIKSGDFHVVHFEDIIVDGEITSALGLFKSDVKNHFISSENTDNGILLSVHEGVIKSKLDKGCLVYNTDKDQGFHVLTIDKTNHGKDASFWSDTFLGIKPVQSEFHSTNEFLSFTKDFVAKQLPNEMDIDKADQADLLNKSMDYFKENEQFERSVFEEQVLRDPVLIDSFSKYQTEREEGNELGIPDQFNISNAAVKRKTRTFKNVIKLDKNFHVYIHGDKDLIEKGVDPETGKKFYKIYFDEES